MSRHFFLKAFLAWRLLLIIFLALAPLFFSLQLNFLGGKLSNYSQNPQLWSWANFDGEHYVSIAANGYLPLQYFFFPVYPILIRLLSFTNSTYSLVQAGHIVSNFSLIIALWGLWKLIQLDYSKKVAQYTILLLLLYPTSFFFAGVYTESVFLATVVWSFYLARKKNWFLAFLLAGVSSGVRIIGIIMLPVLLIEWFCQDKEQRKLKQLLPLPLSLLGIILYMLYLDITTGDPISFKTDLGWVYGEQRSESLILLPQVLYRYIFKILPAMNWSYFEGAYSLLLEFASGIIFLILSLVGYFKLRKSYWLYLSLGYLIPTLSGSFSSISRYVLVLFPGFILLAGYFIRLPKIAQIIILVASLSCMGIAAALFSRGYWIA